VKADEMSSPWAIFDVAPARPSSSNAKRPFWQIAGTVAIGRFEHLLRRDPFPQLGKEATLLIGQPQINAAAVARWPAASIERFSLETNHVLSAKRYEVGSL
jgi:hypothetical protein